MAELVGVPVSNPEITLSANMNLTSLLVNKLFCITYIMQHLQVKNRLYVVCMFCFVVFFIQMLGEPVLFGFHALIGRNFEVNLPWLSQLTSRTITPEMKQLWMRSVVWLSFSTRSSLRFLCIMYIQYIQCICGTAM